MLHSITVSNIAVVSHLQVDFQAGFTAFTGETGAGKSLLLDALNLTLGARAQLSLIRHGASEASVSATFDITSYQALQAHLQNIGLPTEDPQLIIRRHITKDGRTKCFVNDTPTTVVGLKEIGEYLVEIHGQFDRLLSANHHRRVLDDFGQLNDWVHQVKIDYEAWKKSLKKISLSQEEINKAEENREYALFCLQELQNVNPKPEEEDQLLEKRSFLMNYEKLHLGLKAALEELRKKNDVEQSLNTAYRILHHANRDGILDGSLEKIDASISAVQDSLQSLDKTLMDCSVGEGEVSLESIEQRLHSLRALSKKHRCSVHELPTLLTKLQSDIALLDNSKTTLKTLTMEEQRTRETYETSAKILSQKRKDAAAQLKTAVEKELAPLKLQADFFVNSIPLPNEHWSEHGLETIEFFVTTNPGESPGPLSKIASGGELSRLMLALKVALNQKSHVHTVIFDEIDTGLGGAVADAMGKRLKDLSNHAQVLAITHSPQMAAHADFHYQVTKHLEDGRMQTKIQQLSSHEQREEELARMLSGSKITPQAKAAAAQLLKDLQQ